MINFSRAIVVLGIFEFDCFKSESGEYFLSQTQIGKAVNITEGAVRKYFNKRIVSTFSLFDQEKHTTVILRTLDEVSSYFIYQSQKGNKSGQLIISLLVNESLKLRAEKAFGTLTLETLSDVHKLTDDALITALRINAKDAHNTFQRACYGSKMNPSAVHDRVTKLVFGYTAKEARELPMTNLEDDVWLNQAIGINHEHTKDRALMQTYRDVKNKIFSYRKGTWEEKVDRAYREATESI